MTSFTLNSRVVNVPVLSNPTTSINAATFTLSYLTQKIPYFSNLKTAAWTPIPNRIGSVGGTITVNISNALIIAFSNDN